MEHTDAELKTLARDMIGNRIFTSEMVDTKDILAVFMVLNMLSPEQIDEHKAAGHTVCYEYLDKRGPMTVNGYPTFFSCYFLTAAEYTKVIDYYKAARAALDGALAL